MKDFLAQNPLVPVFYHDDVDFSAKMIKACYDGGIKIFEYTNRGEKALGNFKELMPFVKKECPGMKFGIGTIFTVDQAQDFIDASTDFIVQPCFSAEVGAFCATNNTPWIPGVITPTEIHNALTAGAEVVKIFPGNLVGPSYVKSLLGPFKNLKVMVTGGVEPNMESIGSWMGAGATAVGLGSQLFKNDDPAEIAKMVKGLLAKLA
ncbi:2-keto-3-deoxy-phosphogluconate aldolase [Spirosomataceae bacterium TFI 002]|nr:2-keto-3-deoxy-phosphogluconate aldolase [Spirosomataceae bacterium TFI 002]